MSGFGVKVHRPTDRPDVVAMACEAGDYDRESFEHGLMMERFVILLTSAVAVNADVQMVLPRPLYAPIEALAERIGYELSYSDPDHDNDEAVMVVATPKVASTTTSEGGGS